MRYEKEMREPVAKWLEHRGLEAGYELMVSGYADMLGFEFAERIGRPIPNLMRVVVIELKLRDVRGVIRQAVTNKYHIEESWTAMPEDFCLRMDGPTLDLFIEAGVGLLSVPDESWKEVKIIFFPTGGSSYGDWLKGKLWRVHRQNERKFFERCSANLGPGMIA